MHRAMLAGNAGRLEGRASARTNVTDERTDEEWLSPSRDTPSSVTRGRTYEDSSLAIDVLFDLRERLARAGETTALQVVDAEIEWRQAA